MYDITSECHQKMVFAVKSPTLTNSTADNFCYRRLVIDGAGRIQLEIA